MVWIEEVKKKLKLTSMMRIGEGTVDEYKKNKKAALRLVEARLKYFNAHYGYTIGRLSIRNQQSRWGSCNRAGNLSFNYRIVLLQPELQDYLVVHELCHIAEHNHAPTFWRRMQEVLPEAKKLRGELRRLHI
jgi:predicted metal-dependent hydrolase